MEKRNFKFRAYDTVEKKWLFGYELPNLGGFSLIGETILFGQLGTLPLNKLLYDAHFMQSTNLMDDQENEIYEGDFIKCVNPESMFHYKNDNDYSNYFEVRWDNRKHGWNAYPVQTCTNEEAEKLIESFGGGLTWPDDNVLNNYWHYRIIGNRYDGIKEVCKAKEKESQS